MSHEKSKELLVCNKYKIYKLWPDMNKKDDLEASGVYSKDNQFFVSIDNTTSIANISNCVSIGETTAS